MVEINLNLKDCYRSCSVTRWQIVKTVKNQSLSEHSYQVALITKRLCQLYCESEEFTNQAVWYALTHDMAEVLTGDLASPLKKLLGPMALKNLSELEGSIKVLGNSPLPGTSRDSEIRKVVKIADIIEAIAFLTQEASTNHGWSVMSHLQERLDNLNDPVVNRVVAEVLLHDETILDDIVSCFDFDSPDPILAANVSCAQQL